MFVRPPENRFNRHGLPLDADVRKAVSIRPGKIRKSTQTAAISMARIAARSFAMRPQEPGTTTGSGISPEDDVFRFGLGDLLPLNHMS